MFSLIYDIHVQGFPRRGHQGSTLMPKILKILISVAVPPFPHFLNIPSCHFPDRGPHIGKQVSLIAFRQILPNILHEPCFQEHNHDLTEKAR